MTSTTERERVLHLLGNEWAHAELVLQEFRGFFSNPERLALLNAVAGPLMVLVQDIFWEDLLLRVARLTDPVRTGKRQNLAFQQIPELFDDQQERRRELEQRVQTAVEASAFARDWRNRRIGPRDLPHGLDRKAKPLEKASLEQVDQALAAVHTVLDTIAGYDQAGLNAFIQKLGREPNWREYERVVELRSLAKSFPRQDLSRPLRAKIRTWRRLAE